MVAEQPFATGQAVQGGPPPGEIWLTSRLFPILGVAVGDMVGIGATDLRVGAALITEPDSSSSAFNVQPRALINQADLAATQAVQPGSRISYRWLLAGDEADILALQERIGDDIVFAWNVGVAHFRQRPRQHTRLLVTAFQRGAVDGEAPDHLVDDYFAVQADFDELPTERNRRL